MPYAPALVWVRAVLEPRKQVAQWAIIVVIAVLAGYLAVLLGDSRHFYTDDTEAQYVPMWQLLGTELRAGRFPAMVPWEWMAGNYSLEEAGLYNPAQLLVYLLAPSFDNLAAYATAVKLVFSAIAALGVFRICLAYGARAPWAAVAGVAFPFSGWFLFFDEASWFTSQTGTAWLVHAWASAVLYARGRSGPIPLFVFLYLALTIQYAFPAVESGLMIAAVAAGEYLYQRRWAPVLRVLGTAGLAVAASMVANLPILLSSQATWRGDVSTIHNDPFLTVPWSESLNASLPSTVPAFTAWWGHVQPLPMVYIAWFVIPALAFVDWKAAARAASEWSGIALFAVAALMWTAGPGAIGPLRWPARVLPMLAIALLVLVCVLLSRYGVFAASKRRYAAAGALIALLFVRSFSAAPKLLERHLLGVIVVVALGAGVLWLARTRGVTAAAALTIVSIFPIAFAQVAAAPKTPLSYGFPERRSEMTAAFPDFGGRTLQLADRVMVRDEERTLAGTYGSIALGSYAKNLGLQYVNGYTPVGHAAFAGLLCMAWDGGTCPQAYQKVFAVEPSTDTPVVDLMRLDRVVLQRSQYPDAGNKPAPAGWKFVHYPGHEAQIWVLERVNPLPSPGDVIAHESGVHATVMAEGGLTSSATVSSGTGGRIVLSRLAWPGYTATLGDREIPVRAVAGTFVAVDIPPGTRNARLTVTWRPPGLPISLTSAALAVVAVGLLQWWYRRGRRDDSVVEPVTPAPAEEIVTPSGSVAVDA
ncbi:glycosyltransferase family protein [Nocardia asteroides]|uniref:hypothetical protein n=1 Tax=Nocardia asteroides TaxID=1824 RepID=UPI0008F3BA68|nr:hypothetical protein [Nocardia asteroides]UGT49370.1 hypothetical protein LT345_01740 [Nocardia asteroides]SFL88121.1 hypothetical protein SAMN05444423_1011269 [Nocardia asteroides]VEG38159.1 Predicted membrane protein [Nocardia asteroides]